MVWCAVAVLLALQQGGTGPLERATALIESGNPAQAEQVLRAELRPGQADARVWMLLGVALDQQRRFPEAEAFYQQAAAAAPGSPAVWNNLGNHYVAWGKPEQARAAFLKVAAAEPRHVNANFQLAELAAARRKGDEVLRRLERLPATEQGAPAVKLLRARGLFWSGQQDRAAALLEEFERGGDARAHFSAGVAYAEWKRYEQAEAAFSRALEAAPENFETLYNLGLAATNARHLERAREVLEIAVRQRPDDVDALYALARSHAEAGRYEMALVLLVRARRLAPGRVDVLEFLARDSDRLGYFGDAAQLYAELLKARPGDDLVRRDRAFALARVNRYADAIRELEPYVRKHPRDAVGLYYLAMAHAATDPDQSLALLNRALEVNPKYVNALYARGSLAYEAAKFAEALPDLRAALEAEPGNVRAMDRVGQCYLQLDRPQEALPVLERAAALAPGDSKVLMHYSQALRALGRYDEARKALAQFREAGGASHGRVPFAGMLDFLNLPPEQQRARYLANVEKLARENPTDAALQARWGKELLLEGRAEQAAGVYRALLALGPDQKALAASGKVLLDAEQYALAREFLQKAAADGAPDTRLDLAIAVFHAAGPAEGLAELDRSPQADRHGDYYLVRAQVLDALGQFQPAVDALNRGFQEEPARADLYQQASLFLFRNKRYAEALRLLEQANRLLPDQPDLLLTQAVTLETLQRSDEALKLLERISRRWPEWDRPYLVRGIILDLYRKAEEARQMIETAMSLGNRSAEAYYYLALTTTVVNPSDTAAAREAVTRALELKPEDPYFQALAGKIAYNAGDNVTAVKHLTAAVRDFPNLMEAHYTLANAYQALGETEKARTEFGEFRRIREQIAEPGREMPPVGDVLFPVRRPK